MHVTLTTRFKIQDSRFKCFSFIQFTHSFTRRFHSSEFLDALSVLPKDAERLRRKAKHMAKDAA